MEYLAGLYTLLLVAICLELAVVLWRTGKKQNAAQNNEELKRWTHRPKILRPSRPRWRSRTTPPSAA